MSKVGQRAFAVASADQNSVRMYGVGVYLEDEVPSEDAKGFMVEALREAEYPNPCILLDSGEKVYGCECWHGPESRLEGFVNGREIVHESIKEHRKSQTEDSSC